MTNSEIMKSYLQKIVISPLMEKGFIGKYPHFRRENENCIELITFQANKHGGSFTVEVSAVFPNNTNTNCIRGHTQTEEPLTAWDTCERYRLKGMYDGWFYYRDLYSKYVFGLRKHYIDVSEKNIDHFIIPKGYKNEQVFNDETAINICNAVNKQLTQAFKWLTRFQKRNIFN